MYQSSETDLRTGRYILPVVGAILFGTLVGAGAMMLYAPRSGKETRKQIQNNSRELRNRAFGSVRKAVKHTATRSRKLGRSAKDTANSLQEQGRERIADQLGKVASSVKAAQKAVQP